MKDLSFVLEFRAWCKPENKMYDVHTFCDAIVTVHNDKGKKNAFSTLLATDCILEQCTGKQDVNYISIYEGDIIKWQVAKTDLIGVVIWEFFSFMISFDGTSTYLPLGNIEVIGNIHENPELLNKISEA